MGLMQAPPPPIIEVVEPFRGRNRKLNVTTFTVEEDLEKEQIRMGTMILVPSSQLRFPSRVVNPRFENIGEGVSTRFTAVQYGGGMPCLETFTTMDYKSNMAEVPSFKQERAPFDIKDINVIAAANELFSGSSPIAGIEAEVLDRAFRKFVKRTPTMPNRL